MAIDITPDGYIYFTTGDVLQSRNMQLEIKQLESKLTQAVEDIRLLGRTGEFICPVCANYNHGEGTKGECVKCLTGDGFEWRGATNDESVSR